MRQVEGLIGTAQQQQAIDSLQEELIAVAEAQKR
jgi:hypothetical protein